MNKDKVVNLQDKALAVSAFNNVVVVDRSFPRLNNSYENFLNIIDRKFSDLPVFAEPITAHVATAGEIALGLGITATDKVVPLVFDIPDVDVRGKNQSVAIAALLVTMNFDNFTQGFDYAAEWKFLTNKGVDAVAIPSLARSFTITPTAGVNTFSEFAIFPVKVPSYAVKRGTVSINGETISCVNRFTKTKGSFLYPISHQASASGTDLADVGASFLIFKQCSGVSQIKVTPVFAHAYTGEILGPMLNNQQINR